VWICSPSKPSPGREDFKSNKTKKAPGNFWGFLRLFSRYYKLLGANSK
jgi:hypothetical protein